MKTKKIPLRTCIVTKEVLPKQELLRVDINKNKEVSKMATEYLLCYRKYNM